MSAQLADDELLIRRTFDAPPKLIFSLWAEEEHFKKWMGPEGFDCRRAELDFRVGGSYRAMIYSEEHGENWFGGVYREIEPNRRLVFTFAWDEGPSARNETLVTITITERNGKTEQVFHQTPFLNVERRDSHLGGWTSAFDCIEAYVAELSRKGT